MQDSVNSTSKFNSVVVKTLKPVLCFSHDGVPLKFSENLPTLYLNSTDRLSLVSAPVKSRWTIPLNTLFEFISVLLNRYFCPSSRSTPSPSFQGFIRLFYTPVLSRLQLLLTSPPPPTCCRAVAGGPWSGAGLSYSWAVKQ